MFNCNSILLLSSLVVPALCQNWSYLDDASATLSYFGSGWYHTNENENAYNNTISFSNNGDAGYRFTGSFTAFRILFGSKYDRGRFHVVLNGYYVGSGYGWSSSEVGSNSVVQFEVDDLPAATYTVIVYNSNAADPNITTSALPYLTLDAAQIVAAVPTTSVTSGSVTASPSGTQTATSLSRHDLVQLLAPSSPNQTGKIVGIVIGTLCAIVLVVFGTWLLYKRRIARGHLRNVGDADSEKRPSIDEDSSRVDPYVYSTRDSTAWLHAEGVHLARPESLHPASRSSLPVQAPRYEPSGFTLEHMSSDRATSPSTFAGSTPRSTLVYSPQMVQMPLLSPEEEDLKEDWHPPRYQQTNR